MSMMNSVSKDSTRLNIKNSISSNNLTNIPRLDSTSSLHKNTRQLDCNKSIDSLEHVDYDDGIMGSQGGCINGSSGGGGGGNVDQNNKPIKRNTSLISFKSLDFNLKTIYSSIKHKHGSNSKEISVATSTGSNSKNGTTSSSKTSICKTPYVRVETVDRDEAEHLLTFSQSPYQHRGSFDKAGSQYLNAQQEQARSQTNSPFLSINSPPNIRRSSTSDIIENNQPIPSSSSQQDTRRPSTSDLLRRARERKGSGPSTNKIGRSVSQGGIPRGGRGGRRTSMAF